MVLLDTHIWVWWASRSDRLKLSELQVLDDLRMQGALSISSISLWEVANLVGLNRLLLSMPLSEWLALATDPRFVKVESISPAIATEVAFLPDSLHRDPADRLIVAASRVLQRPLYTFDKKIAASGCASIFEG